MKTRNKLGLLMGTAAFALMGTGYAAWTFSKDANAAAFNGAVSITEKATEVGTLTVKDGTVIKLELDQKESNGVRWIDADGNAVTTIVLEYLGADKELEETVKVTVSADYSSNLTDYVTFGDFAEVDSQTWNGGTTALEYTFTLPSVEYTAKYPLNEAAYDTMVSDLASTTIEWTFSAEVEECTH